MPRRKATKAKTTRGRRQGRPREAKGNARASNYCRKARSSGKNAGTKRTTRRRRSRSSTRSRSRSETPNLFPTTAPDNMQGVKFNTYIKKVLKKVRPNMGMTKQTMALMDIFMKDTLDAIGKAAKTKMGKRKVLKPLIIKRALKTLMPRALWASADEHGMKAVELFNAAKAKAKKKRRR
ncbi:histone H2B.2, sperm-like [Biomphalaria glabrata]|uniref:Histone H2B.2, sperm-like n=1 Tax=Biomphalaria glabrata TaxID=6526 RepID=A0A9U8E630_BIOGL|nr:histone H2B.2, sperm-like [Biomphalaria glabrata]